MNFRERTLERDRSRQAKFEQNEGSTGPLKEVKHNIVTTIASTSVDKIGGSGNNKVIIETTVSWSKLPPSIPSKPVFEVINDDETTSTDTRSESSDEKENERSQGCKCPTTARFQRYQVLYSDDSGSLPTQRAEERFTSEDPSTDETATHNNKNLGRSTRLAALANTINHWEDDPRHFLVGKQIDSKLSAKSSVLTKHTVIKEEGNKDHRKFISTQRSKPILKESTFKRPPARDFNSVDSEVKRYQTSEKTLPLIRNDLRAKRKSSQCITGKNTKPVVWDKTVIDSLEAQGFSRTVSNQRLIYNYDEKEKPMTPVKLPSPKAASLLKQSPVKTYSPVKERFNTPAPMGITALKVKDKVVASSSDEDAAISKGVNQLHSSYKPASAPAGGSRFNRVEATSPTKSKDPAELSLAERMALFERNAGQIVMPKAPFAMPVPSTKLQNKSVPAKQKSALSKTPQQCSGSLHERLTVFEKATGDLNKKQQQEIFTERQKELEMLKKRWNKNKEISAPMKDIKPSAPPPSPPPPPPLPSPPRPFEYSRSSSGFYCQREEDHLDHPISPEEAYPVLKEVRKVRFSPPKPGCIYPNLSDIETGSDIQEDLCDLESSDNNRSTSTNSSNESDSSSLGQDNVKLSRTNLKRDWSASESSGAEANEVDDFLEEALQSSSDESTPPKRSSRSYNIKNEQSRSFEKSTCKEDKEEASEKPLFYTVSFYRRQQNMSLKPSTPVRHKATNSTYLREDSTDQTDEEEDRELVEQKIERLQQEVTKQQMYISQASQALNLCYSTFEFSGSTELLEAEKLLLLASQRKQALVHEIQRLRVEARLRPGDPSLTERGSLTISRITLPLRMDFIHHAAKADECYHLVCLVYNNEEVQCSDVMCAPRSLHSHNKLTFPNRFTLNDLYNDFKVTVEVYAMTARHKELIPHDIKYHINTNKKEVSKLRLTPRKAKGESRLQTPVGQSSAGPSAVRTSAFKLAGYIVFSLREIHRTKFTLSKTKNMYTNVLEGSLQLHMETEMCVDVEYRGFLTMFEDVSGLGVWQRRWCLLKGDKLSYWKYPDDERKKIPLDTIELSTCLSKEVEVVRRDVCARPNTIELVISRPARHTDTDSLVLSRRANKTTVRQWLSADTKEERIQWCHHLNKALSLMRAWGISTAL